LRRQTGTLLFNNLAKLLSHSTVMSTVLAHETELLQQLIEGDAAAFREIYEHYQGRIFLFAYRFTKSKDAAEEVVQEVFVKLWERREQIRVEKNFRNYILRITKNLILDGFKKAAHDKKAQQHILSHMNALRSTTAEQLLQKELERLHRQAIDALSPQKKVVYLLSREEELSYDQIAEKLGISKNTVRNQVSDAIQSIREYISSHPDLACLMVAVVMNGMRS
jgi:RNA polymerase sigma-70 factor (family 1)